MTDLIINNRCPNEYEKKEYFKYLLLYLKYNDKINKKSYKTIKGQYIKDTVCALNFLQKEKRLYQKWILFCTEKKTYKFYNI